MSTSTEVETKFIKELEPACISLDGQLPPNLEFSELPIEVTSVDGTNGGNNIVEKIYRGSLLLKDYVTNILIALVVQMSFTRDKITGSSKITTKIIECDNNGIKSVAPHLDKGVCCKCRNGANSQCSVYSACKHRCPNAICQETNGLPIIMESNEEQALEGKPQIVKWINKKRRVRRDDTQRIYSWYQRLLTEEFSPLIHDLLKAQKLSLSRLRRWIITMRPNLRSLYREEDVEVILKSFFPPWYDTVWLSDIIEKLERHLGRDLEIKQSLLKFNMGVDQYFLKRAFVKGVGAKSEPVAIIPIDLEWQHCPAHNLHLIYSRAVRALELVNDCTFTVFFCTVLKEYVIEHKINSTIIGLIEDIKHDDRFEPSAEGGSLSCLEEACFNSMATVLVGGETFGIAIPDLKEGCGCSQFEAYAKSEPATLAGCFKPFNGSYGP